jgi:hypothetical protein
MGHRHRVDVAQQHHRQIPALLEPRQPVAGTRQIGLDVLAQVFGTVGRRPAAIAHQRPQHGVA